MIHKRILFFATLGLFLAACRVPAAQEQAQTIDLTEVYSHVASTLAAQGSLQPGAATVAATPTETGVLFSDDFSNPMSGWEIRNEPSAVTDYRDDQFVIIVNKPDTALWSKPMGVFNDVDISVDALATAGPYKNLFGIICRYQDANNFYRLVLGSDGYAGITKRANGQVTVISGTVLAVSNAVNQGYAANHIEAICKGSHLSLWVNGQLVAETTDEQFANGEIGLIALSPKNESGVEIHFDDFVVKTPQ